MSAPLCDFSHGAVCLDYAGDWFVYIIFSVCLSVIPILHLFFMSFLSVHLLFSIFSVCVPLVLSIFLCIFDAAFLLSIFVFVSLYLLYFNLFLSKLYIQFFCSVCLSLCLARSWMWCVGVLRQSTRSHENHLQIRLESSSG